MDLNSIIRSIQAIVNGSAKWLYSFYMSGRTKKLIIIAGVLFTFFNKESISFILKSLEINFELPPYYSLCFWFLLALILTIAIFRRLSEIKIVEQSTTTQGSSDASAIKGPRSFEEKDRELFKLLQRNKDTDTLKAAILYNNYKIGILTAVSGSGKTSFLKAALLPGLKDAGVKAVIITFSNRSMQQLLKEILHEELQTPRFENDDDTFYKILQRANVTDRLTFVMGV